MTPRAARALLNQRTLLWLKWRVTANAYRRALRRPGRWISLAGLALAFTVECLAFVGLVAAVGYLRAQGFVPPPGFEWTAVALLPLYVLLLLPSATGVELQTQIEARKLLPYPVRVRELFLGAALGRSLGLLLPVPFLVPPVAAAFVLSPSGLGGLFPGLAALALLVVQGIFLAQLIAITFQSSVSSRQGRDALAFAGVFVAMLGWAALQLWVFGNLGSREALLSRVSEGNMPPVLVGRVLADPWGARGLAAVGLLAAEALGTYLAGTALSHYFLNIRVPSKPAAKSVRGIELQALPLSPHANLLLWKDRLYLKRDPLVKAAAYGTLMLVVVAIVSSATTRVADPRVAGSFFLAMFSFIAPWTFLSGLGANLLGSEDGLPFLLATPADRREFLRGKAVFLVTVATVVSAATLVGCAAIFNRADLLPVAIASSLALAVGLTAAGMLSSAFFPSAVSREGFRRKTVSGAGLGAFTLIGVLLAVPVMIANGVPTLLGNRWLLFVTLPLAIALEVAALYSGVNEASRRLAADEGDVLMRIRA